MERDYHDSRNDVIDLAVASEVTNGSGDQAIDVPQGQPLAGILDD